MRADSGFRSMVFGRPIGAGFRRFNPNRLGPADRLRESSLPNHLHQHPLRAASIELAVEDLLPRAEVELAGVELPDPPVDPGTWFNIRLRMPKPTGDFREITLLRPVEWLVEHLAQATALDKEHPQARAVARGDGLHCVVSEDHLGDAGRECWRTCSGSYRTRHSQQSTPPPRALAHSA
jgi:hypothetical protein